MINTDFFKENTWVRCKDNAGLRFITKHKTGVYKETAFEDDGVVSGQSPAPMCFYDGYLPLTVEELNDLLTNHAHKEPSIPDFIKQTRSRLDSIEEKYDWIQKFEPSNKKTFINSPEEKPEWEVLEFRASPNTIGLFSPLKLSKPGFYGFAEISLDAMLYTGASVADGSYLIYSVRRNSDNAIFTVGDRVKCNGMHFNITAFEISHNFLYAKEANNCCVQIAAIKKPEQRKPFMKLSDGQVCFGDTFYKVQDDFNIDSYVAGAANDQTYWITTGFVNSFATREAAEKYVLNHKPCLSLHDIDLVVNPVYMNEVEKLVKERIKL